MKKIAVVTGATSGIGFANVELLLKKEVDVIAVARSIEKKNHLIEHMTSLLNDHVHLHIVMGDLKDHQGVLDVAAGVKKILDGNYQGKLDILMNIAGIVSSGLHLNKDGHEMTFATNHLSVFTLTLSLVPYLEKSTDPRILVVSSLSHYRATINFNNLQNMKCYNILKAYQRSKLYNVFFVKEFQRRYPHLPIYAIDPGLVKTEIGLKNTSKLASSIWSWRVSKGTDAYYPSKFMVDIVLNDAYKNLSGEYFKEGKVKKTNPITYREDYAKRLWEYTENLFT
ncbi:MAG: SDR family NAD(P)-dependent oxidoreductase [Acholeplasmataceae bacterium]|jgi:NAD(P)-dependent dehydrogenase (short-subunit alcohol dehydrogenase family)|nr:SDR family NAD(P)-dependent oxidoreductase [Acholeplasmataceae bacterium]